MSMQLHKKGVCIKLTPEVENFFFSLDNCRNYLVQLKIYASNDYLTPGEQYELQVPLGKGHHVNLTCIGVREPNPEIIVLSHEEIILGKKKSLLRIAAAGTTATLVSMELIYYGSHNIPAITSAIALVQRTLGL